jgi:uncharacterized membrane protein YkvA (DUF1232 family)
MADRDEFVERYVRAILDLPQDAKVLCDVLDDGDLPDDARSLAAGALLAVLHPGDLIPDTWGPLGLLDDAIIVRLAATAALPAGSAAHRRLAERYPSFFANLAGDVEAARAYLGDAFALLEARLARLRTLEHKGRRAGAVLKDEAARARLYEELDEALTDLEITEDELLVAMRRVDHLLAHLRRRLPHR